MKLIIRRAVPEESNELTAISFASKRFWNYPESYFEVWKNELTITPEYIRKNLVNVAECDGEILGYYSVIKIEQDFLAGEVLVSAGYWLEHIFIKPNFIGRGIGSTLIGHVRKTCKELGVKQIQIFADPHSKGFYHKIGAEYIDEYPSSIEGRTVALFRLEI